MLLQNTPDNRQAQAAADNRPLMRLLRAVVAIPNQRQFLRRTRLDELPQFYNILRGDMSFVGPRPERAYFYGEFEKYIPGFSNRLMVVPGLTGHAQVNGGYSLKPEEKIIYDMEYIEKRSIWMDLACIGKTIRVVLCGAGAR